MDYVNWAGLIENEVVECTILRGLGVTPNASLVVINRPDTVIPRFGDLTITQGGVVRTMRNCFCVDGQLQVTTNGGMQTVLRILDRRWAWRWRVISGRYNQPGDLTENPQLLRTARELCALCLDAMGESGYDISVIPETVGPPVNWVQDKAATALHRIVRAYGCEIALSDSENIVRAVLLGDGVIPEMNTDTTAASGDFGETPRPSELQAICARSLWSSWFELEPVIENASGELVPFDEAEYTPEEGWAAFADIENFDDLVDIESPTEAEVEARAAAQRSAFRYYRIVGFADGTLNLPNYEPSPLNSVAECLPLRDANGETHATYAPNDRLSPAELRGTYVLGGDPAAEINSAEWTRYNGRWTLLGETGIVRLERRAYRYVDRIGTTAEQTADIARRADEANTRVMGGNIRPAKLFLRCLFGVASQPLGYTPYRQVFSLPLSGLTIPGVETFVQPQLRVITSVQWNPPTGPGTEEPEWKPTQTGDYVSNYDDVQEQAMQILQDASLLFSGGPEFSMAYRILVTAEVSGTVRQIKITRDTRRGLRSYVSVNMESEIGIRRQSLRDNRSATEPGNASSLRGE